MTAPASRPEVIIRGALEADAGRLAQLLVGIGWFTALQAMTPEELEAKVSAQLAVLCSSDLSTTLVAETPDWSLVGYCSVHWLVDLFLPGPEGYLSELFLLPEARGVGIGGALLDHVVAEAQARGACRLTLLNGRHRQSYQRGFYTKNGWEERDVMANFVYCVGEAGSGSRTSPVECVGADSEG